MLILIYIEFTCLSTYQHYIPKYKNIKELLFFENIMSNNLLKSFKFLIETQEVLKYTLNNENLAY